MTNEELIDAANARVVAQVASSDLAIQQALLQSQLATGGAPLVGYQILKPITLPVDRPVFNPNVDLSYEFKTTFADAFGDFHDDMLSGLADYLARYFPSCITTNTDNWICNTILTGGQGIPADVEALIWQRARGRESLEAVKLEREAAEQFAQRGYVMPPGALAGRLLEVQQDNSNKAVALSREIAIKTFDAYREDVKFAVSEGVKVRLGVLGALGDYLRAWMYPQASAADYAKAAVAAKSQLWNSAADYYRAIISEAELGLRADAIMQNSYDTSQTGNKSAVLALTHDVIETAKAASVLHANIATSSASSLVSMAGTETQLIGSAPA